MRINGSSSTYALYQYNQVGQMTQETKGTKINVLTYNAYGLTTKVVETSTGSKTLVDFVYDELGHRIKKRSYSGSGVLLYTTYYVTDMSGRVLSVYDNNGTALAQKEIPVYGGGRIGVAYKTTTYSYTYELCDHLGNVRAVINRAKSSGQAVLYSWQDYYPHGAPMPNRSYSANSLRHDYQGQYAEKDQETGYNAFDLRMYDARVGRWLSVDPMAQYWSSYMAMGNNPMRIVDPTGGDGEGEEEEGGGGGPPTDGIPETPDDEDGSWANYDERIAGVDRVLYGGQSTQGSYEEYLTRTGTNSGSLTGGNGSNNTDKNGAGNGDDNTATGDKSEKDKSTIGDGKYIIPKILPNPQYQSQTISLDFWDNAAEAVGNNVEDFVNEFGVTVTVLRGLSVQTSGVAYYRTDAGGRMIPDGSRRDPNVRDVQVMEDPGMNFATRGLSHGLENLIGSMEDLNNALNSLIDMVEDIFGPKITTSGIPLSPYGDTLDFGNGDKGVWNNDSRTIEFK